MTRVRVLIEGRAGGSVIIDADGWPLAGGTSTGGPTTVVAECRLGNAMNKAISKHSNVHADRRPELYGRLTHPNPATTTLPARNSSEC